MIQQPHLFRSVQILLSLLNLSLTTDYFCSKILLLLTFYLNSKILSLLLSLILSISKKLINANQAAKFAYQLILFTNAFLNLVVEHEKKTYVYHAIKGDASKTVRELLVKHARPTFKTLLSAFLLIFY